MTLFTDVLIQMGYGVLAMLIAVMLISFIQKGWFWKHLRVKLSFGRKVLVQIKSLPSDRLREGWVDQNQLVIKEGKKPYKRVDITDPGVFYRHMGVFCVAWDEKTGALLKPDLKGIEGFDAKQWTNILAQALTDPASLSKRDQLIIGLMVVTLLVAIVACILVALTRKDIVLTQQMISQVTQGTITAGGAL